jgi:hypothetical protein
MSQSQSQGKRRGRSPKFDALGERGTVTGAVITGAPLNEDGVEDYDAFFRSPEAASKPKQASARKVDARRQERPDKADDLGYVGRKTGVPIKGAPRNSQGLEDIDAFYKSPTEPSHTAKSSKVARSLAVDTETPSQKPAKRARREVTPVRVVDSDDDGSVDMPMDMG